MKIITYIIDKFQKVFPKWLYTWGVDLVAIPVALILFFATAKVLRMIDPTSGAYDPGFLHSIFLVLVKITIYGTATWIMIRHGFKEIWIYFKEEFKLDWNLCNQHYRVVIGLSVFLTLLLMMVSLDKASGQTPGKCVVQTAISQIGVRESTGHNDGVQVEKYLSSVHLSKGNPWCAAFCAWCFDQCSIAHPVSGYCPNWFQSKRDVIFKKDISQWLKKKAQRESLSGSVFGIYFPSKKRVAHVGIIEGFDANILLSIEGNTNDAGSREGDGVYRKRRLVSQIHVIKQAVQI